MSVKVKVNESEEELTKKYPCLMKSDKGLVVLFYEAGVGTVIVPGKSMYEIGNHLKKWADDQFKPFHGTVELSNEAKE